MDLNESTIIVEQMTYEIKENYNFSSSAVCCIFSLKCRHLRGNEGKNRNEKIGCTLANGCISDRIISCMLHSSIEMVIVSSSVFLNCELENEMVKRVYSLANCVEC